jgi:hypothetical protein
MTRLADARGATRRELLLEGRHDGVRAGGRLHDEAHLMATSHERVIGGVQHLEPH